RARTNVEKTFHHDLAGQRSGQGRVLSGSKKSKGEKHACDWNAQRWGKKFISVLNFGDVVLAMFVKGRRGHDENRRVNKQGEHERRARVDRCKFDRLGFSGRGLLIVARLHDRGMEIEI